MAPLGRRSSAAIFSAQPLQRRGHEVMLLSGFASVTKFRILSLLMLVGFGSVMGIVSLRARDGGRELGQKLRDGGQDSEGRMTRTAALGVSAIFGASSEVD